MDLEDITISPQGYLFSCWVTYIYIYIYINRRVRFFCSPTPICSYLLAYQANKFTVVNAMSVLAAMGAVNAV